MNFSKLFIQENCQLLDTHIKIVLSSNFQNVNLNDPIKYNFRCNICGDSKTRSHVKRGYILKDQNPFMFYCHNCRVSITASEWLKEYYPSQYRDYVGDLKLKNNETTKFDNEKHLQKMKQVKLSDEYQEKLEVKHFIPINKKDDKIFEIAKNYCRKRQIPEEIWNKWFVAIDGTYKNRLIIPFFDNNNKTYYYQGRALYNAMIPKYLSRKGDYNNIYNYFVVDKDKPVPVLEGVIDSLFVENSIAMTGIKTDDEKLSIFKNKYFILDGDKAGNEKSIELLTQGFYVFKWNQFIKDLGVGKKDKWDMNEICIKINKTDKFKFEELEQYFTNNIFVKSEFMK